MTPATDKQIDYLLVLVSRATGESYSYLSQARRHLGLSSSKCKRGISKVEASLLIDEWKTKGPAK